ncbi:MAG: energy-coupling factor ABC transporter ATP-binding protein [Pelosinus sp.]|nr:energy-coupling factor ABC transporter ATP-binding protein [Pelosinus sp.]
MAIIKAENFSYAYKHPHKVLDSINLAVEPGSFSVIIGPSGAGKTTLCLAVAGAVPQYFGGSSAGAFEVAGHDIRKTPMHTLALTVGSVLQDYETQLVAMTVEEEVAFSLENQGIDPAEIQLRVTKILAKVGLTGYEKSEVASLSGGQKQRLILASILVTKPKILVLDEPTSALDPQGIASLYRLLSALNKETAMTILVVEHNIAATLPYADHFILLANGALIKNGTPDEVLSLMAKENIFCEAIPPLWQLKFFLESHTNLKLEAWDSEEAASKELTKLLQKKVSGNA